MQGLEQYGWDSGWEAALHAITVGGSEAGRVIAVNRGLCTLWTAEGDRQV